MNVREIRQSSVNTSRLDEQDLTTLIPRIGQGDEAAFTALYHATRALVHALALRIVREPGLAEEVTNEVYLQLYQQAARYDPKRGAPAAWLLTLTRSRAIDHLRRETARGQCEPLPETLPLPSPLADPEAHSAAGELRALVRKALATLSREQRQVIEIAYYAGLSHRQIAAQLGQPLGTVKTRIRIGLNALRAHLGPLLGDALETQLELA